MDSPVVKSPCIDVCRLDETSGLCLGCYRSAEEITRWPYMDNDQRRALLVTLKARAAAQSTGGE